MKTVTCGCGHTRLTLRAEPRMRMICHCTICQRFNKAPQADIAIFRREEVELENAESVSFERYKSPPAVDRGVCAQCGQPALEYLKLPLVPAMAFVPVGMLEGQMTLPAPELRLFYDKRVEDAHDDLPRYSGFLASQFGASRRLLPALRR